MKKGLENRPKILVVNYDLVSNQAKLELNVAIIAARSFFAPAASCGGSNYTDTHNHMLKNGAL